MSSSCQKKMTDSNTVRSILEEYTNNVLDGCTTEGDFLISTFHEKYIDIIVSRIKKVGWMSSGINTVNNGYCTVRFQPYDEWFDEEI